MGRHARSESLFYYFRLEDQVPENHLLRLIDKHIDFGFVQGRTLEDLLHLVVVILVQTTDLLWLFGTLQLAIHITMLRAVVRLHRQATVGLQLPFAAEPVGVCIRGQQQCGSQRTN